jgi:hypothetical protein
MKIRICAQLIARDIQFARYAVLAGRRIARGVTARSSTPSPTVARATDPPTRAFLRRPSLLGPKNGPFLASSLRLLASIPEI